MLVNLTDWGDTEAELHRTGTGQRLGEPTRVFSLCTDLTPSVGLVHSCVILGPGAFAGRLCPVRAEPPAPVSSSLFGLKRGRPSAREEGASTYEWLPGGS